MAGRVSVPNSRWISAVSLRSLSRTVQAYVHLGPLQPGCRARLVNDLTVRALTTTFGRWLVESSLRAVWNRAVQRVGCIDEMVRWCGRPYTFTEPDSGTRRSPQ